MSELGLILLMKLLDALSFFWLSTHPGIPPFSATTPSQNSMAELLLLLAACYSDDVEAFYANRSFCNLENLDA